MRSLPLMNGFRLASACLLMAAVFGIIYYTGSSSSPWNFSAKKNMDSTAIIDPPPAPSSASVIGRNVNSKENLEQNVEEEDVPQYYEEDSQENSQENEPQNLQENPPTIVEAITEKHAQPNLPKNLEPTTEENDQQNDSKLEKNEKQNVQPENGSKNLEIVDLNVHPNVSKTEANTEDNVQKNVPTKLEPKTAKKFPKKFEAKTKENVPKKLEAKTAENIPKKLEAKKEENVPKKFEPKTEENVPENLEKSFYTIAKEAGTDKVTTHQYDCLYEDTLLPYRHMTGLKILEIGLGCNMDYGPGASMQVWASYFTDAQIYFLELNETCGEQWLANITTTYAKKPIITYGDQADVSVLRKMIADHGPWDIIVDDGGHTMNQQITSFFELFPAVTPGGTYFIEDLATCLYTVMGGTDNGVNSISSRTTIGVIGEIFAESIRIRIQNGRPGTTLERITCCDEICGIRTKKLPIGQKQQETSQPATSFKFS